MDPKKDDRIEIIQEKMRKLLQNPPVYKLSEAKRKELISRLYAVEEESKSIVDFIPFKMEPVRVAVAVTALLIFGFMYLFSPLYPVLRDATGTVKVYRASKGEWMMVQVPKVKLGKNDIVKTFGDGQADIIVPGIYHMRLKTDTEVKLARTHSRLIPGSTRYSLAKGKVFSYYKKTKKGKKSLDIETPQAVASVFGTDFMVQVLPAVSRTWVGVLDGFVRVSGMDKPKKDTVMVEAGEKVSVLEGEAPSRPARLMENELLEMEELYRIGKKPQVALLISTGRTRVRELLSLTPLYITTEKKGVLPSKIEDAARAFSRAIREGTKEKHISSIKQFEEIVNKYPSPKYDVQFLLFIGAYYEYVNEHERSIDTFQRIIDEYPKSSLVSIAQCAIGVIYEEKLNDPEKAREAYEAVIANYPRSVEYDEAEEGLRRLTAK